jgi:uncharacterized repeat protein (TIGR04138 family)
MIGDVNQASHQPESLVDDQLLHDWKRIREAAGPYPPDAYAFVQEGLRYTVENRTPVSDDTREDRHVSGRELCEGLRGYARKQFGLLARDVLNHWRIRSTEDFGKIVFAMVEAGLLRKSDEDSLGDFTSVYSFDDAFVGVMDSTTVDSA